MATLFTIIRRKASRIAPLAVRFIGGQRCYYHRHPSALFSAAAIKQFHLSRKLILPTSFSSVRHYSSSLKRPSSDESLLKVIESMNLKRSSLLLLGINYLNFANTDALLFWNILNWKEKSTISIMNWIVLLVNNYLSTIWKYLMLSYCRHNHGDLSLSWQHFG